MKPLGISICSQAFNPSRAGHSLRHEVDSSRAFQILTVIFLWGPGGIYLYTMINTSKSDCVNFSVAPNTLRAF